MGDPQPTRTQEIVEEHERVQEKCSCEEPGAHRPNDLDLPGRCPQQPAQRAQQQRDGRSDDGREQEGGEGVAE